MFITRAVALDHRGRCRPATSGCAMGASRRKPNLLALCTSTKTLGAWPPRVGPSNRAPAPGPSKTSGTLENLPRAWTCFCLDASCVSGSRARVPPPLPRLSPCAPSGRIPPPPLTTTTTTTTHPSTHHGGCCSIFGAHPAPHTHLQHGPCQAPAPQPPCERLVSPQESRAQHPHPPPPNGPRKRSTRGPRASTLPQGPLAWFPVPGAGIGPLVLRAQALASRCATRSQTPRAAC
jgi:hypothetical protein